MARILPRPPSWVRRDIYAAANVCAYSMLAYWRWRATTNTGLSRQSRDARLEPSPCRRVSGCAWPAAKSPFQPFGSAAPPGHESGLKPHTNSRENRLVTPPTARQRTKDCALLLLHAFSCVFVYRAGYSPAPKASGCLSAKREPRRGRKGPSFRVLRTAYPAGTAVVARLARHRLKPCRGDTAA